MRRDELAVLVVILFLIVVQAVVFVSMATRGTVQAEDEETVPNFIHLEN